MKEAIGAILIFVMVLGFIIGGGIYAVKENVAARSCLEHGWPDHKMAFPMTPYCIKRVNQTDTVVALRDLR